MGAGRRPEILRAERADDEVVGNVELRDDRNYPGDLVPENQLEHLTRGCLSRLLFNRNRGVRIWIHGPRLAVGRPGDTGVSAGLNWPARARCALIGLPARDAH